MPNNKPKGSPSRSPKRAAMACPLPTNELGNASFISSQHAQQCLLAASKHAQQRFANFQPTCAAAAMHAYSEPTRAAMPSRQSSAMLAGQLCALANHCREKHVPLPRKISAIAEKIGAIAEKFGHGTHLPGHGPIFSAMGSHGPNFSAMTHNFSAMGSHGSNFWAMAHNFSAMASHGTHLPGHGSDFSAMASHGTHLPGHSSDFSAMGSHGTHLPGHGSNFSAMGSHGTHLPGHGSDFSAMGSHGTHLPGHGSDFSAMGSHGSNFWAMAHNFSAMGSHGTHLPGHGSNFSAMGSHGTHLPGHGSDFSAMGSHGSNFWAMAHNFSAVGSHGTHLSGHGSDFSAMASHGTHLPGHSSDFSAMGSHGTHLSGHGSDFSAMGSHGSNFSAMAHNFSAMGSHGTHLPGHGSDFSAMGSHASNFWAMPHNFSAMGSHGTYLSGHGSDFSAMGSHGSNFWAMAHNFSAMGSHGSNFWAMAHNFSAMASHGTHLPGHGSDFSAMGSHGSNFWAMPQISGQWHTISRQWPAMAHICPAMAQISRQWAVMAYNCPAMAKISLAMAHNFSAMGSHGTHLPGHGSNFSAMGSHGTHLPGHGSDFSAMGSHGTHLPGHGSDFSAMGSHGSNFWAMPHNFWQWAAMAQISGQCLTISRQWAAMAHNCPAMAQISGQWHAISRQWAAMAHNCQAMPHFFQWVSLLISSGKTYTMRGITEKAVNDIMNAIYVPLLIHFVCAMVDLTPDRDFRIRISGLEIYNENVRDPLNSYSGRNLKLLDDPEKGTVVEKLVEETANNDQHLRHLISICKAQRQVGETALNDTNSQLHQIIRLTLESAHPESSDCVRSYVASLNFVDLAGSERASQMNADGARLREGCHINLSLMTLTTVIRKLSIGKRRDHMPYRDSKLTRILQHSLGENARTAIICNLSPAFSHVEQSRNTLYFASRAKEVTNNAQVVSDEQLVKHLQKELARLEAELRTPEPSNEIDLKIQQMEMEIEELKRQRDLAQSQADELRQKFENEQQVLKPFESPSPTTRQSSMTPFTLMHEIRKLEHLQEQLGEEADRALEVLQKEVACHKQGNQNAAETIAKLHAEIREMCAARPAPKEVEVVPSVVAVNKSSIDKLVTSLPNNDDNEEAAPKAKSQSKKKKLLPLASSNCVNRHNFIQSPCSPLSSSWQVMESETEIEIRAPENDAAMPGETPLIATEMLHQRKALHIVVQVQEQRQQILELWGVCHVSVIHRTQFYMFFKGDPADQIYMEVELRRLTWLHQHLAELGNASPAHVGDDEPTISLSSSIRALKREREFIAKRLTMHLTAEEREALYIKWEILLDGKQRKMHFINKLWTDPRNPKHVQESAEIVAKLVGFCESGNLSKEMFELNFVLPSDKRPWIMGWNQISNLLHFLVQHSLEGGEDDEIAPVQGLSADGVACTPPPSRALPHRPRGLALNTLQPCVMPCLLFKNV
ncbi:ATP binding microtubule motor family protein [Actinidia rufa]|uniref:ATP binding microtubule motor family protein n=1 Tax=Actinidia rufa TaxID=165716 RepID=A0A7J0H1H7_9ERIC|nr:ATP binding microtubule motor family protein [Actinidia rufa]